MLDKYALPLVLVFWGALYTLLNLGFGGALPDGMAALFRESASVPPVLQFIVWLSPLALVGAITWALLRDRVLVLLFFLACSLSAGLAAASPPLAASAGPATLAVGILGVGTAEVVRRGHSSIVTNRRIIVREGFLVARERLLRLERVSELQSRQNVLGRLFDFGDIVPIVKVEDPAERTRKRRVKGAPEEQDEWAIRGVHPFMRTRETIFQLMTARLDESYEADREKRDAKEDKKLEEADTLKKIDELLKPSEEPRP